MERTNTISWSDCELVTRKCHLLLEQLMKYQKDSIKVCGTTNSLQGDRMVLVEMINLRNVLDSCIDKSGKRNNPDYKPR